MGRVRSTSVLLLAGCAAACTNFHAVEPGRLYRSAQPDAECLRAWVPEHELRTIVQLRGTDPDEESRAILEHADVEVVRIPMSARAYPTREQLVQLWDAFASIEYPALVHCRAGADRTGLAAAIYVLQRTGDLDRARRELALAYGHTGWGTNRLDRVLEMYGRWHGRMDFRRWASTLYHPPGAYRAQRARAAEGLSP
ncbi:MAG TPA: tyrosine-protein phosphatase [Planctomycetota bacterium]|nr:tyrosine-protein phosphatase [Planctomycetota bacterium]